MFILRLSIFFFVILEILNVIIMYFKPDFKHGNSMRTFIDFEEVKKDRMQYLFVKYMINWVANCKLIFISLLIVIALFGKLQMLRLAVFTMFISIALYFVTLHPIIKILDENDKIHPKGYSKTLHGMIVFNMALFAISLILSFFISF